MPKKSQISNQILKILSQNKAISLPSLAKKISQKPSQKEIYAVNRSVKHLQTAGLIESLSSGQSDFARLSKSGRIRANSLKLSTKSSLVNPTWDGKWRIILLDLPESRKNEREGLRYLLKKAGFVMLKNSAWISPYPFEHLFTNIKKDLGLTTEVMIVVTESLDTETEKEFQTFFFK